ncbi:MAG: hypothetical protein WAT96_06990, partial [Streptococcus suis]
VHNVLKYHKTNSDEQLENSMKIKTIEISGFRQISNATFNLEDNCLCKKTRVWISLDLCKESMNIPKLLNYL